MNDPMIPAAIPERAARLFRTARAETMPADLPTRIRAAASARRRSGWTIRLAAAAAGVVVWLGAVWLASGALTPAATAPTATDRWLNHTHQLWLQVADTGAELDDIAERRLLATLRSPEVDSR